MSLTVLLCSICYLVGVVCGMLAVVLALNTKGKLR